MTNDFLSMPPELSGISQALGIQRGEWGKGKCTMTVDVRISTQIREVLLMGTLHYDA